MKKSIYFKLYELLPRELYISEEKGWEKLNPKLIDTIDAVREMVNVPLLCNTWKSGGSRNLCGFRPQACAIGAKRSTHKEGGAADLISSKISAAKMREIILANKERLPHNIRIENGVKWLHIDVNNATNRKVVLFNP